MEKVLRIYEGDAARLDAYGHPLGIGREDEGRPPTRAEVMVWLGLVSPCTTCAGQKRQPTRLLPNYTCNCHKGRGETECLAHTDWDVCPSCGGDGVELNAEAVERLAKTIGAARIATPITDKQWLDKGFFRAEWKEQLRREAVAVLRSVIKGEQT